MNKIPECAKEFYGTTTIGEKGQVVIPAGARSIMKLRPGEKLLVFGLGDDMVAFCKVDQLEKFASQLSKRLETVRKVIKKSK